MISRLCAFWAYSASKYLQIKQVENKSENIISWKPHVDVPNIAINKLSK
jgi:hypothetical protein